VLISRRVGEAENLWTVLREQGVDVDTRGASTSCHLRLIPGFFDTPIKQLTFMMVVPEYRCLDRQAAPVRRAESRPEVVSQGFSEGVGFRDPGSYGTGRLAHVKKTSCAPPNELPAAGQRHGRNRGPAGRPWTTRDNGSNGGNPPTWKRTA
jgi:hypothetical protein